jgi:hypothetical protein
VKKASQSSDYRNPVETLPEVSPPICTIKHEKDGIKYTVCSRYAEWLDHYRCTVDDLVLKSNVHDCNRNIHKDGEVKLNHLYKGCKDNKWGKCKARFPRLLYKSTYMKRGTIVKYV